MSDIVIEDRFRERFAGSNFLPLVVNVKTASGSAFNLTGASSLWTIRSVSGKNAVVDAAANTNTPGTGGTFEFQPTVAQVSEPGEYAVTVVMTIAGNQHVSRFGLHINPAF